MRAPTAKAIPMYIHTLYPVKVVNSSKHALCRSVLMMCDLVEPATQRVAKEMNLHDDLVYYFALHIVAEEEDGSFTGKTLQLSATVCKCIHW